MVEIFKFMRKHGFRTAKWDTELTCYRHQFFKFDGAPASRADTILGEKLQREWEALNDRLLETFGSLESKPRWFHV